MELSIGQVVISKAGRDEGDVFIIIATQGEYLYLVDGKSRRLANPKKKKAKHVQPTNTVDATIAQTKQEHLKDADLRAALEKFKGKREDGSHGQGRCN